MKKHLFSFLTLSSALLLLIASTPAKEAATGRTITFDYTAKASNKPGSAQILIGLVRPSYAESFRKYSSQDIFRRFRASLGADVEELIIAKGFTIRGPYESRDEMLFSDKKDADIMVVVDVEPEFSNTRGNWKAKSSILNGKVVGYTYKGTTSLTGKINMSGMEPLSGEKIWSKSVLIPTEDLLIEGTQMFDSANNDALMADPAVQQAVGEALERIYKGIMDKLAAHFEPEEFRSLKPQIKELKSKRGY